MLNMECKWVLEASWSFFMMSPRLPRDLDYVSESAHHIYHSQNKQSHQGPLAAQEQELEEKGKYSR